MIDQLVLLSGPISSGKSTLADGLTHQFNMPIFKTRQVLHEKVRKDLADNRKALQAAGERLDKSTRGAWLRDALDKWINDNPDFSAVIVDSVRTLSQIEAIREAFGPRVIHVHLTAPEKDLKERYERRLKSGRGNICTYAEARNDPTEQQVETLSNVADVVIDAKRCTAGDVLVRVSSRLNVRKGKGNGYVDVLVGGQYGSEGKGQISAYLSSEYDLLVRVGGPNAGHQVYEEPPYTHHQLPSGTRKCEARLLIGPGATLNVEKLLQEIADCKVDVDRLSIDPQAMIITKKHIREEQVLVKGIGSTGQGGGAAMASRIKRNKSTKLARDIDALKPYIKNAVDVLDSVFSSGGRVFLEGTQGTGLSLYHGRYPHVTCRDTTALGCLSEAGIAPRRVRRIIMVCRSYPIRVESPSEGTSGYMSQEIDWSVIGKRSGKDPDKLREAEKTSTTKRLRRVGEFDWELLYKSTLLNGPTDIALTFTDYLDNGKKNSAAKRFEQLQTDTIYFIQEIERVTGASVSLIATGFNTRSIIDRRSW